MHSTHAQKRLAAFLVVFRCVNALALTTSFTPDEFWQGPEVAHRLVFGYGHLTWEWKTAIRSYIHPFLLAAPFWILQAVGAATPGLVRAAPRVVHGIIAGLADYCVIRTAQRWLSPSAAWWVAVAQLTSWFNAYCLVRTYSSALETLLLWASLFVWDFPLSCLLQWQSPLSNAGQKPCPRDPTEGALAGLVLGGLSVLVRPTAAVPWLVLGGAALVTRPGDCYRVLREAVPAAAASVVAVGVLVDRVGYGRWVLPLWSFLRFNLLSGGSALYGTHHFLWYYVEGSATVLGPFVVPTVAVFAAGLLARQGRKESRAEKALQEGVAVPRSRAMMVVYAGCLAGLSVVAHKEFRFVLPVLPFALFPAGTGLDLLWGDERRHQWRWRRIVAAVAIGSQALLFLVFGFLHQRGALAATTYLSAVARSGGVTSAYMLMPCHATPLYAHVHVASAGDVELGFPDCSPPGHRPASLFTFPAKNPLDEEAWIHAGVAGAAGTVSGAESAGALDSTVSEESVVTGDPMRFLRALQAYGALPSHLLMYDTLLGHISATDGSDAMQAMGYAEVARFFNSPFPTDHGNTRWVAIFSRISE